MANRLRYETSPYLIQHAGNPVDWYPWGNEALQRSIAEDKPIFLSIGYSACHWCHVMAHESFEDDDIAKLLNTNFICIKVDREERPDLDTIYMNALVTMTGQGGWPMSLFLTPNLQPFYGGTYFPLTRKNGMPSFNDILASVLKAWQENRNEILQAAGEVTLRLSNLEKWSGNEIPEFNSSALDRAAGVLLSGYDWQDGGWGQAPKFPQPMAIEFFLQQANRGNQTAQKAALHALEAMQRGGIFDWAGGGFHRYSTDKHWLVPHFEKMLYDNAQLALVYLHAYQLSGDPSFRQTCQQTLDFITRELVSSEGGIHSSLDADSDGEEGKYYLWTPSELETLISDPEDYRLFCEAYCCHPENHFKGRIILQRHAWLEEQGVGNESKLNGLEYNIEGIRKILLKARQARLSPSVDDKILTSWNGMALQAFAEAGACLGNADYLETARKNAGFLLSNLIQSGTLMRSWRKGTASYLAFLEDYSALILGLLALYQADSDLTWFRAAAKLGIDMVDLFHDPDWGFFDTQKQVENLLIRPRTLQDNATPSGNAAASLALLKLASFYENSSWTALAEKNILQAISMAEIHPTAFAFWLQAANYLSSTQRQIAIVWPQNEKSHHSFLQAYWESYQPTTIMAASNDPPGPDSPSLLKNRTAIAGKTTVYICQNFTCLQPLSDLSHFKQSLLQ